MIILRNSKFLEIVNHCRFKKWTKKYCVRYRPLWEIQILSVAYAIVPKIRIADNFIKMDPQGEIDGTNETVYWLTEAISMMTMANDEINHVRGNNQCAPHKMLSPGIYLVTTLLINWKQSKNQTKWRHEVITAQSLAIFLETEGFFFRIKEFLEKWIQEKRRGMPAEL